MASAVAVVVGDQWTQLQQTRPAPSSCVCDGHAAAPSSVWQGDVDLSGVLGRESRLFVCASYASASSSYHSLLEYTV